MSTAALIYPHQLFPKHPALAGAKTAVLVEDPLFFRQYRFHRQKLMYHRASMKCYAEQLQANGMQVRYLDSRDVPTTQSIGERLRSWKIDRVQIVDPCDDYVSRRLEEGLRGAKIECHTFDDPHFLTPISEIDRFVEGKKKLFFTDFYIEQRKRLNVLIENGKPIGGKWSFDPENRKKMPATLVPPPHASTLPKNFQMRSATTNRCDTRPIVRRP
jgi:deoxyribodipyrimidine photolyase-related protein